MRVRIRTYMANSGVAVGCGWQAFVAYVNIGCYYLVGIPVGCLLGFKFDLGAKVCVRVCIYIDIRKPRIPSKTVNDSYLFLYREYGPE